jgi:chromosome segregation ATPase
MYHNQEPVVF